MYGIVYLGYHFRPPRERSLRSLAFDLRFESKIEPWRTQIWRVSEWLAASLEMKCPARGCEFESRALRSFFLAKWTSVHKSILGSFRRDGRVKRSLGRGLTDSLFSIGVS